jgi:hypothetical protein
MRTVALPAVVVPVVAEVLVDALVVEVVVPTVVDVVVPPDVVVGANVVLVPLLPLAEQDSGGTLFVPFQEPRPPKLVLAPAAMLPL